MVALANLVLLSMPLSWTQAPTCQLPDPPYPSPPPSPHFPPQPPSTPPQLPPPALLARLRHLVQDLDGNFSPALKWLAHHKARRAEKGIQVLRCGYNSLRNREKGKLMLRWTTGNSSRFKSLRQPMVPVEDHLLSQATKRHSIRLRPSSFGRSLWKS